MFLFDDPKDYDPLEQIENRANPPATSVGMPLALVALSGGAGLAVGGAVVGGSLAALPAYFLVKKMGKVWTNNVFLRRNPGCYAHLIRSDRDMVQWIEAHGKDDVADQLRVALIQRQRLTTCAKRTAKLLIAPESLPPKNVVTYLTAETPTGIDSSQLKSAQIPTPTAETSTPQATQKAGQAQDERSLFMHLADNPFLCWFILASQRTGKTSSAAAASLTIKREHGTEVYYINLSDHGQGNREAFAHADRAAIGDINGSNSGDAARLIQAAIAVVEQFHQSNNAILVVDEWVNLALKVRSGMDAFWAVLSPKAAALTSNGIGCGRSVWAIAPTFQAATMREDAKVVKSFVPLILSVAPGQTIDWANPQSGVTSKLPYNGALIGQAARNWPDAGITEPTAEDARQWQRDGVSRVFWADRRWSALGQAPAIPKTATAPTYEVVTAAATIEPSVVDAALPDLYQAIAHMTVAQAQTETPGTINPDGSKTPIGPSGDDDAQAEIIRYLRSGDGPKLVKEIRSGSRPPVKGMASSEIRQMLEKMMQSGTIQTDGTRFFCE